MSPPSPLSPSLAADAPLRQHHPARQNSRVSVWTQRLLLMATPIRLAVLQIGVVVLFLALVLATPARGQARLVDLTANEGAHRRLNFWREALESAPGVNWLPPGYFSVQPSVHTWGIRATLLSLLLLQILAIAGCSRRPGPFHARWFIGPSLSALLLLLLPPLSADLFYYAISGYAVTQGINPYLIPPEGVPAGPLLALNDWRDITSPYGPVWTHLSALVSWLIGPDPLAIAVSFKLLALFVAAGLVGLVYSFALWLTADRHRATVAAVVVAWQPALLIESAGTGHHDALMALLVLGGLWLVVRSERGSTRLGLILITLSVLVKYATLPVLALALLWRMTQFRSKTRQIAIAWGFDVLTIAVATLLSFTPYWEGRSTLNSLANQPGRLFTNPLWQVIGFIAGAFGTGVFNQASAIGAALAATLVFGLVVGLAVRFHSVGQGSSRSQIWLLQACAIALVGLTLLPFNVHPWYLIWPVGVVALCWVAATPRPGSEVNRLVPSAPAQGSPSHSLKAMGVGASTRQFPLWLWLYFMFAAVVMLGYHTRLGT